MEIVKILKKQEVTVFLISQFSVIEIIFNQIELKKLLLCEFFNFFPKFPSKYILLSKKLLFSLCQLFFQTTNVMHGGLNFGN